MPSAFNSSSTGKSSGQSARSSLRRIARSPSRMRAVGLFRYVSDSSTARVPGANLTCLPSQNIATPKYCGCSVQKKNPTRSSGIPAARTREQSSATTASGVPSRRPLCNSQSMTGAIDHCAIAGTSVQAALLEEVGAILRVHGDAQLLALALDGQRHVDAGIAEMPDAAEKCRQPGNRVARDFEHHV